MMDRIYLDYAATAPLSPAARDAMLPWLGGLLATRPACTEMAGKPRKPFSRPAGRWLKRSARNRTKSISHPAEPKATTGR